MISIYKAKQRSYKSRTDVKLEKKRCKYQKLKCKKNKGDPVCCPHFGIVTLVMMAMEFLQKMNKEEQSNRGAERGTGDGLEAAR